ncbi:MAG: ferritin family protein [Dehalococcoidia bacterium]|jgi:rubrerythrin
MAEFLNPFQGILPNRTLSLGELIRAIRQDIAAEEEATHLYTAQAEASDNELARRVLLDIADEERVHVGEFSRLLSILTEGEEDRFLAQGAQEVDEMAGEGQPPAGETSGSAMTVGSLKG